MLAQAMKISKHTFGLAADETYLKLTPESGLKGMNVRGNIGGKSRGTSVAADVATGAWRTVWAADSNPQSPPDRDFVFDL